MAAGAFQVYGNAKEQMARGVIDIDTHTFVCTAHSQSYTPNLNTHSTWADVKTSELPTGSGYTAGGLVLAMTVNRASGTVTIDSTVDPAWTAVGTLTSKYGIVTKRAGGALVDADLLLGYIDMETTQAAGLSSTNGTLGITWNASGMFTMA